MADEWQRHVETRLRELEKDRAVNSRDKEYMERRFNSVEDHLVKVENKCDLGFRDVNKKIQSAVIWFLALVGGTILLAFLNFALEGGLSIGP